MIIIKLKYIVYIKFLLDKATLQVNDHYSCIKLSRSQNIMKFSDYNSQIQSPSLQKCKIKNNSLPVSRFLPFCYLHPGCKSLVSSLISYILHPLPNYWPWNTNLFSLTTEIFSEREKKNYPKGGFKGNTVAMLSVLSIESNNQAWTLPLLWKLLKWIPDLYRSLNSKLAFHLNDDHY